MTDISRNVLIQHIIHTTDNDSLSWTEGRYLNGPAYDATLPSGKKLNYRSVHNNILRVTTPQEIDVFITLSDDEARNLRSCIARHCARTVDKENRKLYTDIVSDLRELEGLA